MQEQENKKIVTRFAPSPTGFMHMGSVRTALFAYLFARRNGGKFILRIEDTDKERSKKEFDDGILSAMKWLGFEYDELYRQSERTEIYKKYIEKLLKEGNAYVSKEDPLADPGPAGSEPRRAEVIRFKNPNKIIKFTDLIRGEIEFDTTELGDFVIAKSVTEPIFHLAVAVDDFEMGITHVIRGEDHISTAPRHILISEAIGSHGLVFGHLPLVLAPDRSKLSKRKHGEIVSLEYYRKLGYLPEAVINFMALIGWNPGGNEELFSLPELVKVFDISKVQKSGAIFNVEKLDWFNRHYIQKLTPEEKLTCLGELASENGESYAKKLLTLKDKPAIVELMAERIANFSELRDAISRGDYDYFFEAPSCDKKMLLWKSEPDFAKTKNRLSAVLELFKTVPAESFTKENIKNAVWPFAEKEGRGEVLWPARVALSGKEKSPDPFTLASMLGQEESIKRIETAIKLL